MKLLSRFIWLIIAILVLVFAGIALFQIKTNNEFELIKNSIKEEYDVQVDKMMAPDRYAGISSYLLEIKNDAASSVFLSGNNPDTYYTEINLHPDILKYNDVDAVWFFKPDGTMFYFKSNSALVKNQMPVPNDEIPDFLDSDNIRTFYTSIDNKIVYFNGARISETSMGNTGYVIMASVMDKRWIDKFSGSINNSVISILTANENLPEIENITIRIIRELKGYKGNLEGTLNIELHLPFLSLWNTTNTNDKWLMIGSMVIVIFFLLVFLSIWVISPLKRISVSLAKGTPSQIQPLVKGHTEMNDVARMITDYYKKTEELEASESVKRHIFEKAQVAILISDEDSGLINTSNPFACKLIDAPEDAILGNVIQNFLAQVNPNSNLSEGFESMLFNTNKQDIPILRTRTQMMMEGKKAVMDTFVDLSEIKSLQEKLEEEKKKLSLAVQNSGLIFCEYDFKTDNLAIAKNWSFLSKGENELLGQNVIDNIYDSDKKIILNKIDSISKGVKDTLVAEFRVKHPERGLIWISASILITKRDEEHKPKQLIGLLEDITERILVQQELIKAKEKAEESDRMKSSYLGSMSHKIRTPLNSIVGFANLLTEEDVEADEKENFINIIRNDTEQVLHLIDDIISIAKIDANQLDINKKTCHANKIIDNLSDYYKVNKKTENIKLNIKTMLPDGKDMLLTDGDKLNQALDGLLNNAFKFTKEGAIELGYFINPVDSKLIFYVKDTGIGIPDESRDKIFNRFYQVNPLSDGTGLGLTISNSIVKLLKGRLFFDSKANEGSTFYIELPFNEV